MKSGLFKLNLRDFLRGLLVAILTAIIAVIYEAIQTGSGIDWKLVIIAGVTAALGYLSTNLFTNSTGELLTSDK